MNEAVQFCPVSETGSISPQPCSGKAPSVSGHSAVYVPHESQACHPDGLGKEGAIVVCGGMDQSAPAVHNDVWVLDHATWAWRSVDVACGAVPEPRTGHTAAVHGSGMWLVGGANPEAGPLGDVWVLWMCQEQWFWQPVDVTPPLQPRELHCMLTLSTPKETDDTIHLAVWGGRDRTGLVRSIQQLQLPCACSSTPAEDGVPCMQGGSSTVAGTLQSGVAASSQCCALQVAAAPAVLAASFGGFDGSALTAAVTLLRAHTTTGEAEQADAGMDTGKVAVEDAAASDVADSDVAVQALEGVTAAAAPDTQAVPNFAAAALPHASKEGALWVIGGLTGPQCADTVQLLQITPSE